MIHLKTFWSYLIAPQKIGVLVVAARPGDLVAVDAVVDGERGPREERGRVVPHDDQRPAHDYVRQQAAGVGQLDHVRRPKQERHDRGGQAGEDDGRRRGERLRVHVRQLPARDKDRREKDGWRKFCVQKKKKVPQTVRSDQQSTVQSTSFQNVRPDLWLVSLPYERKRRNFSQMRFVLLSKTWLHGQISYSSTNFDFVKGSLFSVVNLCYLNNVHISASFTSWFHNLS